MSSKAVDLLTLLSLSLSGCSLFSSSHNLIAGDAVLRTRGGEPRTCAGFPVLLLPRSSASEKWAEKMFGRGDAGYSPMLTVAEASTEPGADVITQQVMCDSQGKFSFTNVGDGNYFVVTEVSWEVGDEKQGGLLMKAVEVRGGDKTTVALSEIGVEPHVAQLEPNPTASGAEPVQTAAQSPSVPDEDPHAGAIMTNCHMGECFWTKTLGVKTVSRTPIGTLRLETSYEGSSLHPGEQQYPKHYSRAVPIKWRNGTRSTYAFCSTKRPAVAYQSDNGSWTGDYLDLFNVFGYNEDSAITYMRLCHGREFTSDEGELRTLGYAPGTPSDQVTLTTPFDLPNAKVGN